MQAPAGLRFGVLRGEDLLALDFEVVNLRVEPRPEAPPRLVPIAQPAFLIVHFPPQHILEEAFPLGTAPGRARAVLAEPSRLVFRVGGELSFTLDDLLGWDREVFAPSLPTPDGAPDPLTTAIELPYRLLLAPAGAARWRHRLDPRSTSDAAGGRWVELWHTRLEAEPADRAVWALAARRPGAGDPFERVPVNDVARGHIARQSRAETSAQGGAPDIPVDRLMLSSLGAWLDLDGTWASGDVAEWRHVAALGRDQLVRVAIRGFLFPFGHRASFTTISERTFADGDGTAYLEQRRLLTILEPEKEYASRDMPLRRVRIETTVTPPLDNDLSAGGWPTVGGSRVVFRLVGYDWSGRRADFALPLGFVPESHAATAADVLGRFRERAEFAGQAVTLAPAAPDDQATRLAVQAITFDDVRVPLAPGSTDPPFRPRMESAAVVLPALNQLFGGQRPVEIRMAETFLAAGFDDENAGRANPGQLFAEFVDGGLPLQPPAQQAGGFVAPSLNFVGLSRALGPVSGQGADPAAALAEIAGGRFDPVQYLGNQAKLFGTISLADLLPKVEFEPPATTAPDQIDVEALLRQINALDEGQRTEELRRRLEEDAGPARFIKVPTLSTRELVDERGVPNGVDVTYLWKPKLNEPPGQVVRLTDRSQLWMITRLVARGGEEPDYRVEGHFTDFELSLLEVMSVTFRRLRFRTERGKGLDFTPEIGKIAFGGPLRFVNDLSAVLEAVGVAPPFGVDVQPTHVTASYDLPLPSFAVGIFGIENVRLSTALKLPFVAEAGPVAVRFALAERSAPFLVSVSLFAGGGYFALELDTAGGVAVEAAIEFGGKFSINLVVASGGVYVLGGIYFSLRPGRGVHLEGYLRCGGWVDVLGIAGVSVEFYLGLFYDEDRNVLGGTASVKACLEVLFFSECLSFDVEYEFAGPPVENARRLLGWRAPPQAGQRANQERLGFGDLIEPEVWATYCAAFA